MKLITSVELIESTVESVLIKELPHEVSHLTTSQHLSKNKGGDRMMKETKGGESAVALPSNEYPNGQIRKPETLNGASQKSSPIKKLFEVTKSMSFDMTVKKVTIPPQWEKLSLNSPEGNTESKSKGSINGISHEPVCDEKTNVQVPEDEVQRASKESISLDFAEDSEQFGLSDSEVDKLLEDVDDKEGAESSTKSDIKEKNGIEHSENDECIETITAAGDEDMCGNSKKSSNAIDVVVSSNAQSENIQSSTLICAGDDIKVLKTADIVIDAVGDKTDRRTSTTTTATVNSEEEMTVKSQDNSAELESSLETVVNADKGSEHLGNCDASYHKLVKEKKLYDKELDNANESSHKPSALEHEEENNDMSSKPDEMPHSQLYNETSVEDKSGVHLLHESGNDLENEGNEADLKLQSNEIEPSKMFGDIEMQDVSVEPSEKSTDTEMQNNGTELSEKSSDVEMQDGPVEPSEKSTDIEMQNVDTELSEKSSDVEMQNCQNDNSQDIEMQDSSSMHHDQLDSDRKSVHIHGQDDKTKPDEQSSDADCPVGPHVADDQIDAADEDSQHSCNKPNMKSSALGDDTRTEQGDKLSLVKNGNSDVPINVIRIRVRDSCVLQALIDSKENDERVVDEENVPRSKPSNEENDTVSSEKEKFLVEPEHAVDNIKVDRLVRKRSSNLDNDDGARETKRTRVESSDSASKCDKESEDVHDEERDEETVKASRVQEPRDEAVGENGEEIGAMDKESSEKEKDSESVEESSERDKEGGEDSKEGGERDAEGSERKEEVSGNCEEEKEGSEKDQEKCSVENDKADRDMSEDGEVVNSCSKRVHEPMGLIEVKKVCISPEMEKQLKMAEGKASSSEKPQIEGEEKQEKSLPSKVPKSNLDLAIERVATGLTDELEETKAPEATRKFNSMPFMRNLHQNLLKKLSRNELEELVVQKLCEVVTDRCNLGDMRQRCQSLEQMVDQWRKRAQQLQKQLRDMEMVMKRYIGDTRTRNERPIPVKITRSVGLQVHLGALGPGMMRNRTLGGDSLRTPGQVRRRINRVSSPPVAAPMQQPSQQQQPQPQQQQQPQSQPRQAQPIVRTATTNPLTVQKVVTPGFTKITTTTAATSQSVVRAPITTLVATAPPSLKMGPSPVKNIRPVSVSTTTTTAAATTIVSMTSTINTINNTVVNTTNNLRVATASQLNNRQQPKPSSAYAPNKPNSDLRVIDLTDEEDRAKNSIVRQMNAASATIATNLVPSSSVTTAVSISSSSGIQAGSIRVVQPHQLTGTTAATILAPSASGPTTSRVAYFVPTTGVQQRQVLIASSASQVRPGVMSVSSRQNQLPTLLFKNGTVVPIQQASGTPVNTTAILRPGPSVQANQLQQVLNPTRTGQQIRVSPSLVTTVGRMTAPALASVNSVIGNKHPAPLPNPPVYQPNNINWKFAPPKPELKISKVSSKHQQGIVLSWNMQLTSEYEEIASYQLYAYQEGSAQPSTTLWKKVGDVKALPLPMACTLTQFMEGHKYHFAVRAVDVHTRVGPFSTPGNIVLTRK